MLIVLARQPSFGTEDTLLQDRATGLKFEKAALHGEEGETASMASQRRATRTPLPYAKATFVVVRLNDISRGPTKELGSRDPGEGMEWNVAAAACALHASSNHPSNNI
jgi:hypothetical protein